MTLVVRTTKAWEEERVCWSTISLVIESKCRKMTTGLRNGKQQKLSAAQAHSPRQLHRRDATPKHAVKTRSRECGGEAARLPPERGWMEGQKAGSHVAHHAVDSKADVPLCLMQSLEAGLLVVAEAHVLHLLQLRRVLGSKLLRRGLWCRCRCRGRSA